MMKCVDIDCTVLILVVDGSASVCVCHADKLRKVEHLHLMFVSLCVTVSPPGRDRCPTPGKIALPVIAALRGDLQIGGSEAGWV